MFGKGTKTAMNSIVKSKSTCVVALGVAVAAVTVLVLDDASRNFPPPGRPALREDDPD